MPRRQWGEFVKYAYQRGFMSQDEVYEWLRRSALAVVVADSHTIGIYLSRQDGNLGDYRYRVHVNSIAIDGRHVAFAGDTGWHFSWSGTLAGTADSLVLQVPSELGASRVQIDWEWEIVSTSGTMATWNDVTEVILKPNSSTTLHPF
jgi:hypothetical protein